MTGDAKFDKKVSAAVTERRSGLTERACRPCSAAESFHWGTHDSRAHGAEQLEDVSVVRRISFCAGNGDCELIVMLSLVYLFPAAESSRTDRVLRD